MHPFGTILKICESMFVLCPSKISPVSELLLRLYRLNERQFGDEETS
jgi:hypothetical protein